MSTPAHHDLFPTSPAYLEMQPLRIPTGWMIGMNQLSVGMDVMPDAPPGVAGYRSPVFNATNEWRRFNIDIEVEAGPEGAFHLTVTYAPWPRNSRGRRIKDQPLSFWPDGEVVHQLSTGAYEELVAQLEYWIARCTVWAREGH
jgi:hypothetical protein